MTQAEGKLELLSIHSADVDWDALDPTNPPNSVGLQLCIGVPDGPSSIYGILFVSNAQAAHMTTDDRFISMPVLSRDLIETVLEALVADCLRSDRPEDALRTVFEWEYEDYKG